MFASKQGRIAVLILSAVCLEFYGSAQTKRAAPAPLGSAQGQPAAAAVGQYGPIDYKDGRFLPITKNDLKRCQGGEFGFCMQAAFVAEQHRDFYRALAYLLSGYDGATGLQLSTAALELQNQGGTMQAAQIFQRMCRGTLDLWRRSISCKSWGENLEKNGDTFNAPTAYAEARNLGVAAGLDTGPDLRGQVISEMDAYNAQHGNQPASAQPAGVNTPSGTPVGSGGDLIQRTLEEQLRQLAAQRAAATASAQSKFGYIHSSCQRRWGQWTGACCTVYQTQSDCQQQGSRSACVAVDTSALANQLPRNGAYPACDGD